MYNWRVKYLLKFCIYLNASMDISIFRCCNFLISDNVSALSIYAQINIQFELCSMCNNSHWIYQRKQKQQQQKIHLNAEVQFGTGQKLTLHVIPLMESPIDFLFINSIDKTPNISIKSNHWLNCNFINAMSKHWNYSNIINYRI